MAEKWEDQLERVRMMAAGSGKWDLSPNDVAAIKAVLDRVESAASITTTVGEVAPEVEQDSQYGRIVIDEKYGPAWPVPNKLYKHYKGDLYFVLMLSEHHETRLPQVVYLSLAKGSVNVRPLHGSEQDPDGWMVSVNGQPRFARVDV